VKSQPRQLADWTLWTDQLVKIVDGNIAIIAPSVIFFKFAGGVGELTSLLLNQPQVCLSADCPVTYRTVCR